MGCDRKSAENHYDYLTRNKKLPKLKRHGRTVIAQKTTTSQTQIRSEGQLRWHAVLDAVWDDLTKHNVLPPGDARKIFELVKEHFWLNLDETCIQCNDGNIRIVGSKERKTQSKITDDSRFSITILRVGNAAGSDGPIIIILKGKDKKIYSKVLNDIVKAFGCPPGSCVINTPSAYMTDEAWKELVPALIKGIRQMPVIRDYPQFKCMVSMDGYVRVPKLYNSLFCFYISQQLYCYDFFFKGMVLICYQNASNNSLMH